MNTPLLGTQPKKSNFRRFAWVFLAGALVFALYSTLPVSGKNLPLLDRPLKLTVYTHNIRYANGGGLDPDEKRWDQRKQGVINSIDFNTATGYANVVNLQEVLAGQLVDIISGLNENAIEGEEWAYYGIGRADGKSAGEFAPILYKPSDWLLLSNETFWLSPTPEKPSKGWDAALERILTSVVLRSKHNPLLTINFFNTHFDNSGENARRESTKFIIGKLRESEHPVFLAGDLNTQPSDVPYGLLKKSGFHDSRTLIDPRFSYGENTTFSGFNRKKEDNTIIDYIWSPTYSTNIDQPQDPDLDEKVGVVLRRYGVLNNYLKGEYISDHRPVVANFDVFRRVLW